MLGIAKNFKVSFVSLICLITSCDVDLSFKSYATSFAFFSTELQGNVSHLHAILRTMIDITDPEGLKQVLNKIRGCVADLIHDSEIIEMQNKGWISSVQHLVEILNQAKAYLTHHCDERCQIPRIDEDGNTYYIC